MARKLLRLSSSDPAIRVGLAELKRPAANISASFNCKSPREEI